MVKGLDKFREYFADFSEQHVLIGGAACDISFEEGGADFRATKDLDIVLVVEALTKEFGQRFWEKVSLPAILTKQKPFRSNSEIIKG